MKELIGVLKEYNKNEIILEFENKLIKIDMKNIISVKTVFKF